MEKKIIRRRRLIGIVVSDKMQKTRVVRVPLVLRHDLYGKTLRRDKRFKFHDERNASKEGDRVMVIECRPISADKRFRLVKIIKRPGATGTR